MLDLGTAAVAGIVGIATSLAGFITAAASTRLANRYISPRSKKINAESEKRFRTASAGTSWNDQSNPVAELGASIAHGDLFSLAGGTQAKATPQFEAKANIAKDQVCLRLKEIIEQREHEQTTTKWLRRASYTLTWGQYIVGATLTTSLAQNTISKTWLSIFGLIVILCSATKHHYHVDESAQAADSRFHKLRSLARYAQDQISILEIKPLTGKERTDAYIALLDGITQRLGLIEESDYNVVTPIPKTDRQQKDTDESE
jgi:hypothetical protein